VPVTSTQGRHTRHGATSLALAIWNIPKAKRSSGAPAKATLRGSSLGASARAADRAGRHMAQFQESDSGDVRAGKESESLLGLR
jgi:hypothetical protein